MRRREFITVLGGAVVVSPIAALAQQNDRIKRIGVLVGAATEHDPESEARLAAFRIGLKELGWFEGRNVRIDYRFASGDADRIRTYVTELVKLGPDLIVANSSPVVAELKRATGTIPIVFAIVNDPVNQGLVTSLAHPGGNITGFTLIEFEIIGKWLELLMEMAPRISRAKLLFNPVTAPFYVNWLREHGTVSVASIELEPAPVHDQAEIEATMTTLARSRRGTDYRGGCVHGCQPQLDHKFGRALPVASDVSIPAVRRRRWPNVLRTRYGRYLPTSGGLRRPHSQRRQSCRPAGPAADEIPASPKSERGEGARADCAAFAGRPR